MASCQSANKSSSDLYHLPYSEFFYVRWFSYATIEEINQVTQVLLEKIYIIDKITKLQKLH